MTIELLMCQRASNPIPKDVFMHIDMNDFSLQTVPNIASQQIFAIFNQTPAHDVATIVYIGAMSPILAVGDRVSTSGWTAPSTLGYNFVGEVITVVSPTVVEVKIDSGGPFPPTFAAFGGPLTRISRADKDGAIIIYGDLSGNNRNLNRPKASAAWTLGSQGGRQTLEAASEFAWLLSDPFVLAQPLTIVMTLKQVSDNTTRFQYDDQNPSNKFSRASALTVSLITAGTQLVNGTMGSAYHSEVVRFDGTNSRIISSSATEKIGDAGTNGITEGLIFNAGMFGHDGDVMGIAKIIIYSTGLSNDEMDLVLAQLQGESGT